MLTQSNPEAAKRLLALAQEDVSGALEAVRALAACHAGGAEAATTRRRRQ